MSGHKWVTLSMVDVTCRRYMIYIFFKNSYLIAIFLNVNILMLHVFITILHVDIFNSHVDIFGRKKTGTQGAEVCHHVSGIATVVLFAKCWLGVFSMVHLKLKTCSFLWFVRHSQRESGLVEADWDFNVCICMVSIRILHRAGVYGKQWIPR